MGDSFNFHNELTRLRDETLDRINNSCRGSFEQLEELWSKMFGHRPAIFNERYQTVQQHFVEMLDAMVSEERESFEEYRDTLNCLLKECDNLRKELSIPIPLPFSVDIDGINLRQQMKDLKDYLQHYTEIRAKRLKTLETYKKEEAKLCEKLGEVPQYASFEEVPSEEKLNEIKGKISSLNKEKSKRQKSYQNVVNEVKTLLNDLEITDISDPDYKVALDHRENFVLSEENLFKLEEWKTNLHFELESEIKSIAELKEKTLLLWNRLDIGAEEREQILMKTTKPYGRTVKEIWQKELQRCEALKQINIENVILRCREIIKGLWDDCHISESERLLFTDYYSNEFDEELLASHESKEAELREYLEKNRELFSSADKWFALWNKMCSLESRSNCSERLNNRGGQLLKEEKERKTIQKQLPNEQSKLKKLTSKFEEENGVPFKYDGHNLMNLIELYWENRRLEKENEKKTRKVQNLTSESTPLKGSRTATPGSGILTRKRGRPLTPIDNVPKKIEAKKNGNLPSKQKIGRRSRSHEPVGRPLRSNTARLLRYDSHNNLHSASANSSTMSYTGFQEYFDNKNKGAMGGMSLRSSSSPGSILGTYGPKTHTIFKTPSSTVKSASKRTRLDPTSSRLRRPIIF